MTRPKQILTIAFFCILTILKSGRLFACSCDGESTVRESVKYSDIVFKGRVVSKLVTSDLSAFGVRVKGDTTSNSFASRQIKNPVAVYNIKVFKIYKGESQVDTISIITPTSGAGCGFGFQVGQDYIVYGTTKDGTIMGNSVERLATNTKTYWTNLCTRTTQFFQQEEDEIRATKN